MEKVIGVNDLRGLGLLQTDYTELDLYDAFMMYLILNDLSDSDRVILQDNGYVLDSIDCFKMDNWMV